MPTSHRSRRRRVDARELCSKTGLTRDERARLIDVDGPILGADPAAPIAQLPFEHLHDLGSCCKLFFPSDAGIRDLLDQPIPRFHGNTTRWLLETHGVDAFAGLASEMTSESNGKTTAVVISR